MNVNELTDRMRALCGRKVDADSETCRIDWVCLTVTEHGVQVSAGDEYGFLGDLSGVLGDTAEDALARLERDVEHAEAEHRRWLAEMERDDE